jgi:hypothetical protein
MLVPNGIRRCIGAYGGSAEPKSGSISMVSKSNITPAQAPLEIAREAYSIPEWCTSIGISRAFFYKLPTDERPVVVKLGRRSIITRRASEAWQERMTRRAEEQA